MLDSRCRTGRIRLRMARIGPREVATLTVCMTEIWIPQLDKRIHQSLLGRSWLPPGRCLRLCIRARQDYTRGKGHSLEAVRHPPAIPAQDPGFRIFRTVVALIEYQFRMRAAEICFPDGDLNNACKLEILRGGRITKLSLTPMNITNVMHICHCQRQLGCDGPSSTEPEEPS